MTRLKLRRLTILITAELLLIIFLFSSCKKGEDIPDYYVNTPIAGFSWTGNNGPAPVTVQFVNTSEYADQFAWDFGDGGTSTGHSPQHTYHNGGIEPKNYLVILKATDSSTGQFQRRSQVIVIQPGG